jgi:hypothetical protein
MPPEVQTNSRELCVLRRSEKDMGTGVRRITAADSISVPLVCRILCEQSFHPYNIRRVQAPTTPGHRTRAVFCQWLLANYLVNTYRVIKKYGLNFVRVYFLIYT